MGVYIKGMEIPKNEPLLVKINPDGSVSTTAKNGYKKYEAVTVQAHGDLIDRDNLLMIVNQIKGQSGFPERFVLDVVERAIKSRRAVIPAEEAET